MEHIIYQLEEDLAILTLNRPEVANGFHIPMCEEILEALTLAEENPAVHFILINANGKVFSVGGDLVEMKRAVDEDDIPSLTKIAELVNTISYKIKQIAKPVLMEVDGAVAGAAANMA
ncbi:enoyl-CoA hydratase/isomerase family protein, partial [Streptococcus pneumoniae]